MIICLIIYLIYSIINGLFKPKNVIIETPQNNNSNDLSYDIVSTSESDSDVIDTIFMEGLSEKEYKSILDYKPTLIESNNKYSFVNYDFERMMHYSELSDLYKSLNNSDIVNLYVIGKSVDGRDIYGIEIGKGKDVLFIDANIHAAEVATTLILTRFLTEIVNDYENDTSNIKSLLNGVKIASIPCINPDGYEIYNYGIESLNNKNLWVYQNSSLLNLDNIKSNANGVDLNRNFPTQNEGLYYKGYNLISNTSIEKTTKSGKYFNGYSSASEPETKASMYFMLKHYKNTYAYINLHSQGRVIYAGKPNLSSSFNDLTVSFANKVSKINGYKVHGLSSEEVGEGNDGSATDFMAELANGFKFSTKTGRLSSSKYKDNNPSFVYKYPVITMETMKTWTKDPSYFKTEYYDFGLRTLFYKLLSKDF